MAAWNLKPSRRSFLRGALLGSVASGSLLSGRLQAQASRCPKPGYLYDAQTSSFDSHVAAGNENTAGVDYHLKHGAPVIAIGSGVMGYRTENYFGGSGGNSVGISHATIAIYYSHLEQISDLQIGKQLKRGEVLRFEGSSGGQDISHLHMSIEANALMGRSSRFKVHRYGADRFSSNEFTRYGWGEFYVSPDSLTAQPAIAPLFKRPFDPRSDAEIEAPLVTAMSELRELGQWYFDDFDASRSSGNFFPIFWDWLEEDFLFYTIINRVFHTWQVEMAASTISDFDRKFLEQFFDKVEEANEAIQLTSPSISTDPDVIRLLAIQNPDFVSDILNPSFNGCYLPAEEVDAYRDD
ncbi:MAG: M23 family metallopeptidase [Rhodospirillaceae bacterium]|nr:M23 family metallopeptidase [Rhodospirillaceae bacterium]